MSEESITEVIRYRTPDGEDHPTRESAEYHLKRTADVCAANDILNRGFSVAQALRRLGRTEIPEILERVTNQTGLVIEHWQCMSEPGYKVREFLLNGGVRVYGDAGSWSGPYGGDVRIADLARYASDPRTTHLIHQT